MFGRPECRSASQENRLSGRPRASSRLLEFAWRQRFSSSSLSAHVFALICVAIAVAAIFAFESPGFRIAPYATLFPAILIAAIAGGAFAGITALISGGIAAWVLLLPSGTILVSQASQITSLILYGVTGLFLILLVVLMRRAAVQLDASREEAHDEHDRLVAALEASGAGTWRWNIQNDIVEWDDALCRLYGIAPKNAPRTSAGFIEIIHPDDRAHAGEVIRRCVEEGIDAEYEFRAVVPKGTLWIYDRSKLVRDAEGGPAYMMGACIDVTERRRTEEERGRIATWLRMAMEVAQIGTWEIDPDSGMVTGSDSMNAIFGLPADGAGRPMKEYIARIHPKDARGVEEGVAQRIAQNEPISLEYRLVQPNGDIHWIASRGAFVRAADGGRRIVGALFDITDRKRIEEEREAALAQRELLLKELNHRVKNNLQMVSSLLNLQASRLSDPSSKEHFRKAIDRVQAVGDIHARLYQGEQLGRIDFDEYLKDLCDRLRDSMLDGKSIALRVETEPLVLDVDRAIPLGLVVNELVTNSIKHAFPNGAKGNIFVQLTKGGAGEVLRLSIGDDGRGVEKKDGNERDGLGMRLVEGLMQQVGGTMEIKNERGARYEISVPAGEKAPQAT
jgi:PAS domain S-box-containing protein